MADQIEEAVNIRIEGKGELRDDRERKRDHKKIQDLGIKRLPAPEQEADGAEEKKGNDELAVFLERGQSRVCQETVREKVTNEDGNDNEGKHHRIKGKNQASRKFSSEEKGGQDKRNPLHIAGGNP